MLYALLAWGLVGWSVIAWLSRPEPGPEDSDDDDGGIPPMDNLSGPDWGAWDEMETRELEEVR